MLAYFSRIFETHVNGECTLETTYNFENRLLQEIETKFGKTTEGWQEVLYVTKAATPKSVVNAWQKYWANSIIATGRRAVESHTSILLLKWQLVSPFLKSYCGHLCT